MVAVWITKERTPAELRVLARRERDGRVGARLLALANALDGMGRGAAARAAGMGRQTLRAGSTAATPRASRACATGRARGGRAAWTRAGRRRSRRWCSAVRSWGGTAGWLGGPPVCAARAG